MKFAVKVSLIKQLHFMLNTLKNFVTRTDKAFHNLWARKALNYYNALGFMQVFSHKFSSVVSLMERDERAQKPESEESRYENI